MNPTPVSNKKNIPCPICADESEKKPLFEIDLVHGMPHDLVECCHCGVKYFSPLPDNWELAGFYDSIYHGHFDKYTEWGRGLAFSSRLKRFKKKGNFLDVGCALGYFISGIKDHSDWDVWGVEFGEAGAGHAKNELGLDVFQGELYDAGYPDSFFDFIHINNVIEHVCDPNRILKECRRILKRDGRVFLSVPNGSNDMLPLQDYSLEMKLPARSFNGHIYFFSQKALHLLFEKSGLEIQKCKTYGIKRGLQNLKKLPRKKSWHEKVASNSSSPKTSSPLLVVNDKKKRHSAFYYHYRLVKVTLGLPGLHKFGLDYLFTLKPKNM